MKKERKKEGNIRRNNMEMNRKKQEKTESLRKSKKRKHMENKRKVQCKKKGTK